jgi:hypothetical protein
MKLSFAALWMKCFLQNLPIRIKHRQKYLTFFFSSATKNFNGHSLVGHKSAEMCISFSHNLTKSNARRLSDSAVRYKINTDRRIINFTDVYYFDIATTHSIFAYTCFSRPLYYVYYAAAY